MYLIEDFLCYTPIPPPFVSVSCFQVILRRYCSQYVAYLTDIVVNCILINTNTTDPDMATTTDANSPSTEDDSTFVDIYWRKADDVLRGVSEKKVQDCKEDLDGFLLFVRSVPLSCAELTHP